MTGKERINLIFHHGIADRCGYWSGNPVQEAKDIFYPYLGVDNDLDFAVMMHDDAIWVPAEWDAWKHTGNGPLWDTSRNRDRKSLDSEGALADCETIEEVMKFNWPDPSMLDLTHIISKMDKATDKGLAIFGGCWTYITTLVMEFFGMENLFIKMYTHPSVVDAVTDQIVDFYMEANERFFQEAGNKLDVFFFASDLGSQEDLLISPEMFRRFFLPGFKKIVDLAKRYDYSVLLHSCGSVSKIIPDLIGIGVDGLHPLQAKAKGMQAEDLARHYRDDIVFVGGVDTQDLLPFGTPEQIQTEVQRLIDVLVVGISYPPAMKLFYRM